MQTDVYFRWYDLNIKDKEQDDRNLNPIEALQAKIRRNTGNSIDDVAKDEQYLQNSPNATEKSTQLTAAAAPDGDKGSASEHTSAESVQS